MNSTKTRIVSPPFRDLVMHDRIVQGVLSLLRLTNFRNIKYSGVDVNHKSRRVIPGLHAVHDVMSH